MGAAAAVAGQGLDRPGKIEEIILLLGTMLLLATCGLRLKGGEGRENVVMQGGGSSVGAEVGKGVMEEGYQGVMEDEVYQEVMEDEGYQGVMEEEVYQVEMEV